MPNFAFSTRYFSTILITLCVLTASMLSLAEPIPSSLKFEQLSSKDGLSQSYVYDMVQDKQGFIWIATQDGLNRYDGNEFVHYRHNILETTSIVNNMIRTLFIDKDNTLWVGTNNGLSKYNRKTDDFKNFTSIENNNYSLKDNVIWDIYQDNNDKLWVTSQTGIHNFLSDEVGFERILIRKYENKLKEIKTIFQDKQRRFWLGTYENGIYISNEDQSKTVSLKSDNKWHLLIPANTLYDVKIIDEHYWLATDLGIYVVDENYQLLKQYTSSDPLFPLLSNEVRSIEKVDDTTVWVGTSKGLSVLNLHDSSIEYYQKSKDKNSLTADHIYKLLISHSNNILVGTGAGISTFNPAYQSFKHHLFNDEFGSQGIDAFAELSNGDVWLAREDVGVFQISVDNSITQIKMPIVGDISQMFTNTKGSVIVHTYEHKLLEYSLDFKTITEHKYWYDGGSQAKNKSLSLVKNKIWFLDEIGRLKNYDLRTNEFSKTLLIEGFHFTSFTVEKNNTFWLTTSKNLLIKFNPVSSKFDVLPLIENSEYFVKNTHNIAVSDRWIWLGSYQQGLMLVDRKNYNSWVFNEKNGVANNFINALIIDDKGGAWFGTNKGISSINPGNKAIRNYAQNFGVFDNEYLDGSFLNSSDNIMYFGGIKGFHYFDYNEVKSIEQQLHTPVFTEFLIANKKIQISQKLSTLTNKEFVLPMHIDSLESLLLKHEQSPFSIEFVSPNASLPNQVKYRYRLVGLEEKWIETGLDNRRATYTNLDAGDYTFEVQAIDLLGSSDSDVAQLKVTIMPPWWLSWWAYILYGISSLSLVFTFIHSQRKKLIFERNVNAQLENKVVERTLQLQRRTEELQKSNIMLEEMSLTDQLTGLKNRRFLLNNIESDIALVLRKYKSSHESKSKNKPEAVDLTFFLIDLDHFKMVNDIHGHTAGDAVLIQIKVILEQVFRETDYLVRWGGEEFLVIARFTERSNAPELAERLRKTVENYEFSIGEDNIIKKTCSIGFACYPFSTQDTEALTWNQVIDVADHCMYAAKKSSRNAWVGLYSNTNGRGDDLFKAVIEQTKSLLQTDELEIRSSITEVDKVNWLGDELIPVQASN